MKIQRLERTKAQKAYWRSLRRLAREVAKWPTWKKETPHLMDDRKHWTEKIWPNGVPPPVESENSMATDYPRADTCPDGDPHVLRCIRCELPATGLPPAEPGIEPWTADKKARAIALLDQWIEEADTHALTDCEQQFFDRLANSQPKAAEPVIETLRGRLATDGLISEYVSAKIAFDDKRLDDDGDTSRLKRLIAAEQELIAAVMLRTQGDAPEVIERDALLRASGQEDANR